MKDQKTATIDFVRFGAETAEQALANLMKGFEVTGRVLREVGDAGHPEAEITGERDEVDSLLMDLGYLNDDDPIH